MPPPDDVYTHGHDDAVLRSHRWRTAANSAGYLLDHLRPGLDLLDVGCGPGTLTVDLAARVAPGRVLGVDVAPEVVADAAGHAREAGRPGSSSRPATSATSTCRPRGSTWCTPTRSSSTCGNRSAPWRPWRG